MANVTHNARAVRKQLERIIVDFDASKKAALTSAMNDTLEHMKSISPVKSGRYRDGHQLGIGGSGGSFSATIINSVPYAPFVERGRKTKRGKIVKGARVFAKGRKLLFDRLKTIGLETR
jgi:hypothetical protein